ncbi:MAG: diacylglycerol kinase family protein [Novosphingobium aromaticivorans]|nr:diacylglycerol kinase family protein [Novosphingobium aromaticivorans]
MKLDFMHQGGGVTKLHARDFAPSEDNHPIPRVGVISNPRSHRNRGRARPTALPEAYVIKREPSSRNELMSVLTQFVNEGVELIVIDGGDGTVRDVLSVAHGVYRGKLPRIAVIPSGKTNALAYDLGLPSHWNLGDAIAAHAADHTIDRAPIHIHWNNNALPDQLGFIFGLGVFSRATMLAQNVHRKGLFNGVAVFFTLAMAFLKSLFGGDRNSWRRGDMARVSRNGVEIFAERVYLILASTLRKMPAGLRPFGRVRDGLKFLTVKAPPRALARNILPVLTGAESSELEADGYLRRDADRIYLSLDRSFILDGEQFPGGNLIVSRGEPIHFVVPANA